MGFTDEVLESKKHIKTASFLTNLYGIELHITE
jgi:hypothetical protein